MMNYLTIVIYLLMTILRMNSVYAGESYQIKDIQHRIQKGENTANWGLLKNLFTADAVYLNPEGPPIVGDQAIQSLYEFMFNRYKWSSSYQNDTTEIKGDSTWVRGIYSYKLIPKNGGDIQEDRIPFEWLLTKENASWKLAQLIYGEKVEPQSRVPVLPVPTGKYAVGIRDFYFTGSERSEVFTEDKSDAREVAFQIWYPVQIVRSQKPRPYQNLAMTKAAANFLNWPLFINSYNVFVKSNSFSNADAIAPSQPYPVILYNHGYGGFTTVHQTICRHRY